MLKSFPKSKKKVFDVLVLLVMAVQYLCQENVDLILSAKVIPLTIKKLPDIKTKYESFHNISVNFKIFEHHDLLDFYDICICDSCL